jgi:hypothetical protein
MVHMVERDPIVAAARDAPPEDCAYRRIVVNLRRHKTELHRAKTGSLEITIWRLRPENLPTAGKIRYCVLDPMFKMQEIRFGQEYAGCTKSSNRNEVSWKQISGE